MYYLVFSGSAQFGLFHGWVMEIDSINFPPVRHPKFDIENLIRLTFVSTKPILFFQLKALLEIEIENLNRN